MRSKIRHPRFRLIVASTNQPIRNNNIWTYNDALVEQEWYEEQIGERVKVEKIFHSGIGAE